MPLPLYKLLIAAPAAKIAVFSLVLPFPLQSILHKQPKGAYLFGKFFKDVLQEQM